MKSAAANAPTTAQRAIALARTDLACYCALAWPRFELAPHHRLIVEKLEAVERGEIDRLMIFMPPRHGKSLLASQLYPAWYIGRHPDRSIIAASYGQELASDFGRRVRNLVADPLHRDIFPSCVPSADSTAAHRFNLINGGAYYAAGAGGPLTGRGADLLLIDDAVKSRAEAYSAIERQRLSEWYESVAYTRLQPGAAVVVIQTRWHQDDLCGWLLREDADEGWTVLSLPALAEPDDALHRAEGAPLWPSKFSVRKLERIRVAVGGSAWAALYQQRPAAAEGAIFKREWWRYFTPATVPARFEQVILSLDTAFKAGASNDYSAGAVLGVGEKGYYLLDMWRDRVGFPELKKQVEMLVLKWNPEVVLVEDKASGQSLIQEFRASGRLPMLPVKVDSDKVTRASAVTPLVEAGKVYVPESATWLADFLDEVSAFPAAPHDDMVDALTQGLNHVRNSNLGIADYYHEEAMIAAGLRPPHDPDEPNELIEAYEQAWDELNGPEDGGRDTRPCAGCGKAISRNAPLVANRSGNRYHGECCPRDP